MTCEANSAATLSMSFSATAGERPMTLLRQDPPWRVVRGFRGTSGDWLVHMHNLSGGVLGGDRLQLKVTVGDGARVLLTSTGATRIYKHRAGRAMASCRTHASVARHALLEYLPDQLIPYRDSQFAQQTEIELDPEDAGLFWWETITSGRTASGESFCYATLQIHSVVSCGERPIAIDQFELEPRRRSLQRPGVLNDFTCCSTFYICKTGVGQAEWMVLLGLLEDEVELLSSAAVQWGTSRLVEHGIVIRGVSHESSSLQAGLHQFRKIAKRYLYGSEAEMPRKVY